MKNFSKRLAEARENVGISQTALAERMHIERSSVSHWERSVTFPSTENLASLSRILNVSIDWLLTGDGAMAMNPKQVKDNESTYELSNKKELTQQEIELLESFSNLNDEQRVLLATFLKSLK